MPAFFRNNLCVSLISARGQNGPCPMQLVVLIAVKNAVSAATITFTASSIKPVIEQLILQEKSE